jgi:hypothetical protein
MKFNFTLSVVIASFLICACTKVMVMNKRLPSEWNIASYEEKTGDGTAVSVINIGSIRFESNGTGTKSINFRLLDKSIEDYQPFEWKVLADTVIISGTSYFSRAWTVTQNTPSNQVWQSRDKMGGVQTMMLAKNKVNKDNRISAKANND